MSKLLAAALLIASTSVASAGVYGGLSVGPDPAVQDNRFDLTSSGRALRLLGGYRIGRLSAEASIMGNTLRDSQGEIDHREYAIAGRYSFPLGSNFELFGRAGLQYTTFSLFQDTYDYGGKGIILGPGVEYVIKLVAASVAIRLDYTIGYAKTSSDSYPDGIDLTTGQWMLGFTVGM